MIKFVLVVIYLILVAIFSIPLYLYVNILGKFNKRKKVATSQKIVVVLLKIVLKICGIKVDARGVENVPTDEPVLYMANHRGYFDIVASYTTVPTLVGFVSKQEIKMIPALGVWMKYLNCLFLDRKNAKAGIKMVMQAIQNIKNGYSMFIMPEGSRSKSYKMLPFKKGCFKIASKANCKIVPVAIANSAEVFEKSFPRIKSGTIIIEYGKPIDIPSMTKEEQRDADKVTKAAIQEMLDKIKQDV
jgi:1-acyl-sn-glycerol-3-phosphate acyltransferase